MALNKAGSSLNPVPHGTARYGSASAPPLRGTERQILENCAGASFPSNSGKPARRIRKKSDTKYESAFKKFTEHIKTRTLESQDLVDPPRRQRAVEVSRFKR